MTELKKVAAVEPANVENVEVANSKPTRKPKRGLGNARGTVRFKFTHEDAKPNGLFIAHLDSVEVKKITIGEDTTGMPSFNGLEIPKIVFTFASNDVDVTKRKYVMMQFNAVESNVNTIPGGSEEWKVNSVLDNIKHILDTFVFKGRALTEEEEELLALDYEDFDENGEYSPIDVENVINGWEKFFVNVEQLINRGRDGKPFYVTDKNQSIPVWIKLIRYIKNKKNGWKSVNNGELAFPAFVGEGIIEVYKQNTMPSIRLNSINEKIIPMELPTNQTPNSNINSGMQAGVPIGGMQLPDSPMDMGAASMMNVGEDMPF